MCVVGVMLVDVCVRMCVGVMIVSDDVLNTLIVCVI